MKPTLSYLSAVALWLGASTAHSADFTVIRQELAVERPAAAVWAKVGADFCGLGQWMKVPCVYTSGSGDVGTVRRIADRISEVMVAKAPLAYTYADLDPKLLYHGTLAVEPLDARRSRIVYTLVYDPTSIGAADVQETDRARRAAMFMRAMQSMKAMAEAN